MNKILKILTMSGLASTLALTNNQMKVEECPECENIDSMVETAVDSTTENENSNVHLTDTAQQNIEISSIETYPSVDERPVVIDDDFLHDNDQNLSDNNQENNDTTDNNQNSENSTINQEKYTYDDYFACYESLKMKLTEAIECNQKYAVKCENCNDLTDEEKEKLITNYNELKELIEALEDNNDNVLCNISGENCDNEIDDEVMEILNQLKQRIMMIQNAMYSMPKLDGQNPSIAFYSNPYHNIYGYYYRYYPTQPITNSEIDENSNNPINEDNNQVNDENNTLNQKNDSAENSSEENKSKRRNIDTYAKLRRPSNIDTYGPQYRNIDTFFNTALIDDNMFDYNSENFGGYGNYGMGYMGNPYMYGGKVNGYNGSNGGYYNPNYQSTPIPNTNEGDMNNQNLRNENNNQNINHNQNNVTIKPNKQLKVEAETEDSTEEKKFRFGKNIDTYNEQTLQGNVNTMGGKKVTEYVKDMFKKYFGKKKNNDEKTIKTEEQNVQQNEQQNNQISQIEINNYVDNFIDKNKNNPIKDYTPNSSIQDNKKIQNIDDNNNTKNKSKNIKKVENINMQIDNNINAKNENSTEDNFIKKVDVPILY